MRVRVPLQLVTANPTDLVVLAIVSESLKGLDKSWLIRYTSMMQITKEQLAEIIKETVRVAYSWEGVHTSIAMPEVIKEITDKYYFDESDDET